MWPEQLRWKQASDLGGIDGPWGHQNFVSLEGHAFPLKREIKWSNVPFAASTHPAKLSSLFHSQPQSFQHGRCKVSNVTGNLLWITVCGVWNEGETAEHITFFIHRLWGWNPWSQTKLLPRILQCPIRPKLCGCYQRCCRGSPVRH